MTMIEVIDSLSEIESIGAFKEDKFVILSEMILCYLS